jgi:hypothetical protein
MLDEPLKSTKSPLVFDQRRFFVRRENPSGWLAQRIVGFVTTLSHSKKCRTRSLSI